MNSKYQSAELAEVDPKIDFGRPSWMAIFILVTLGVLVGGYWSIATRIQILGDELRSEMLDQAILIARTINPELVKELSFTEADAALPQFQVLRQQLAAYHTVTAYRGIYTIALREGELRFGPESYSENDPQASPPGTVYKEPSQEDFDIFENAQPIVQGPFSDEYGSFVSAAAPVVDPRSGEVLMVVGIDLETVDWEASLGRERFNAILPVILLAGVLIAGVLLTWWRDTLPVGQRARWRYLEAYIIGVFGLVLTLILAQAVHEAETRSRRETFSQLAESKVQLLVNAFSNLQDHRLGSLVRFFETSEFVTRDEFSEFTAPMVRRAAIQAMAWAVPVQADALRDWELRAQVEGVPDYTVWRAGEQPVSRFGQTIYYPVWYLEPVEGNEEALGFDLGSEIVRITAIQEVLETGLPTATGPIILVVGEEDNISLGAYAPVFRGSGESRILNGIVVAVIRLDEFLQSILPLSATGASSALVELYQLEDVNPPHFLASSSPEHTEFHRLDDDSSLLLHDQNSGLSQVYPMFVFSKTYGILVEADESFLASNPLRSGWTTLLVGGLFTALMTSLVVYVSGRRADLESQVHARTIELEQSQEQLIQAYDATIEGWSHALDLRDKETEGHTLRVAELTERLARSMGIGEEVLQHIHRGALLHDIGKIGVSDSILLKKGELTEAEWEAIRQHPQFAHDMLAPIDYLKPALDIPYCHHEKWDGTGYPRGLKGEAIPLAARIFAVADVFDALSSDRPYRAAWSKQDVVNYIIQESGKYFDPQVVRVFLREIGEGDRMAGKE